MRVSAETSKRYPEVLLPKWMERKWMELMGKQQHKKNEVSVYGYPHEKIMEEMELSADEYREYLKQFTENGKHLIYTLGDDIYEIYCIEKQNNAIVATLW